MSDQQDSAEAFIALVSAKAPEYKDLITARTETEFEMAFDALLGRAVDRLQSNAKNFKKLGETGLTGALAGFLDVPGLTVTQETNSNGHVDLTVEADHCSPPRKKLGEAKLYSGPAYHFAGLKQLMDYMTGAEMGGLLLAYVRQENITVLMQKLRDAADQKRPERQTGPATNHTLGWSFRTEHTHSTGKPVKVAHIGCNLHCS